MKNKFDKPSTISVILVGLIVIFTIIPVIWLILLSFKTNTEIMLEPMKLPTFQNWDNYKYALNRIPFLNMLKNTLFQIVIALPLELLIAFFAAFALSRNRAISNKKRNSIRVFFVCGLIIPASVMLYPIFFIMTKLDLVNTHWSVILVHIGWAMPLGILNLVNAIDAIPGSLEEAAVLDGCSIWSLIYKVYLPLVKPALATLAIVMFLGLWNDFLLCKTLLTGVETRTISMAAIYFKGEFSVDYAMMAAAAVILIVPQLAVYCALQKYIISGTVAGAVKG